MKEFSKHFHIVMNHTNKEVRKIKSIVQRDVLDYIVDNSSYENNCFPMSKGNKIKMCEELNISDKQARQALLALTKTDLLKNINNNYYLNPLYYWKGHTREREKFLKQLQDLRFEDGLDINYAELLANPV